MVFKHYPTFTHVDEGCHESQYRVRAIVPTSNGEVRTTTLPMLEVFPPNADAVAAEVAVSLKEEQEQEELIKKLEASVEQLEEQNAQIEQDAREEQGKLERLLNCVVCMDVLTNPQLLECGHSMCHSCLRTWWETSDAAKGTFVMSRWQEQPFAIWPGANSENNVGFQYNDRYQLQFPVPQPKLCPYCKTITTRRPAPNPILGNIVHRIMQSHLQAEPSITPGNKDGNDIGIWEGMFRSQHDNDGEKNEVECDNSELQLEEGLRLCHREFQKLHQNMTRMVQMIPIVQRERDALRNRLESSY